MTTSSTYFESSVGNRRIAPALTSSQGHEIEYVNPLRVRDWNERLTAYPEASFFHTATWAQVLADTYSYQPCFGISRTYAPHSLIVPLMEVDSVLTGRRGISLPFTDECHVLGGDDKARRSLFRQLVSRATLRRWKYIELRGRIPAFEDVAPSTSFHGHALQLERDSNTAFANITGRARTAVRKARNEGVHVDIATDGEAMRSFYDLLCESRKSHGAPAQPARFFDNIHRHIIKADAGKIFIAKKDNKPIAAAIFFHFGRMAIYKYAGAAKAPKPLQGSSLVLWKAIEHYGRMGFSMLDLGRTSLSNAGLRQFKLAWGAAERRIDYFRYSLPQNDFVVSGDRSSSRLSSILLKSLPPRVSQLVGAVAYRHFA